MAVPSGTLIASSGGAGAFVHGQPYTITGSGFGTKPNGTKPLYWWPFEAEVSPSVLSRNTSQPSGAINGALSSAIALPSGSTKAFRWDLAASNETLFLNDLLPFASDQLYVWIKRYYDFTFATSPEFNLKEFRPQYPGTPSHNMYHSYNGVDGGDGNPRYNCEYTGDGAIWGGHPFLGQSWFVDEWEYQTGTVNATDGILNHIRNARHAFNPATQRFKMLTSSYSNKYNYLALDQKSGGSGLATAWAYVDALYVDDSWCRVILSSEPSWQTAALPLGVEYSREIQIPSAWSDASITITSNQGALSSGTQYLYVVTSTGTVVSCGPVTVS